MRIRAFRRESVFIAWVMVLVFSCSFYLPKNAFLSTLSSKSSDFFFRYRYDRARLSETAGRIVIVNVDEETLLRVNQRWPLNRGFYEHFIRKIYDGDAAPAAVGIDLIFSGKSDRPDEDVSLARALKKAGSVVIASYFNDEGRLILPEETLAKSAKAVGFISSPRDYDLVIRRAYPSIFLKDGAQDHSFVLKTFSAAKNIDPKSLAVPVNGRDHTFRINYLARPKDFKTVPFWKALSMEPAGTFKGKIVLVGTDIEMNHDVYPTPLGLMSGVAINANILMELLLNRFPGGLPAAFNLALLVATGFLVGFATDRLHNVKGLILCAAVVAGAFYGTVILLSKDIVFDFFGLAFVSAASFISVAISKHISVLIENARLRKLALTDGLTGLYAFRYFEIKLNGEMKAALTGNADLSLIIFDIDHFKVINDTYGHDLGNKILKKVAMTIKRHARRSDMVARFGGDEFAMVLPRADTATGKRLAEAVRKAVEETVLNWQGKAVKATISAGVSSLSGARPASASDLIKSADGALYKAKISGRNKIVVVE